MQRVNKELIAELPKCDGDDLWTIVLNELCKFRFTESFSSNNTSKHNWNMVLEQIFRNKKRMKILSSKNFLMEMQMWLQMWSYLIVFRWLQKFVPYHNERSKQYIYQFLPVLNDGLTLLMISGSSQRLNDNNASKHILERSTRCT